MTSPIQNVPDLPPQITLCVGAVVVNEDEVLFVRQTYGRLKGAWSIPWGYVDGKTPDGSLEPPDRAAVRETYEEARVVAEVEGLIGLQNHCNSRGELWVYLLYLCHHIDGQPTPDQQETDGAAYLSLEDMDTLSEPISDYCAWLARRVLRGEHHLLPPEPANPYHPHLAFM